MNNTFIANGRINDTRIINNVFVKTAIRTEKNRHLRLARERWSLLIAKERGLRVPEVVDYYINDYEKEVLELQAIEGKSLSLFPLDIQAEVMKKVGLDLLKLKSVSKKFGWPSHETFDGEFNNWEDFLYYFINRYGNRLIKHRILTKQEIEKLIDKLRKNNFSIRESDLVHRDIKPSNIVFSKQSSEYWIVDWENTFLGEGIFDLATYSGNYGRDNLWKMLAIGFGENPIHSEKYLTYEKIALLGTIDFYRKHRLDYSEKIALFR